MINHGLKDRFWIIEVFVRDVVRPLPTLSLVERKDVWDQQFNCKNDVKPMSLTHGVELVILAEGSMGIYLDTANRARLFPGIIKWERMWNSYIYRMKCSIHCWQNLWRQLRTTVGLSYTLEQIKHSRTESLIWSNSFTEITASSFSLRTHGCATTSKKLSPTIKISLIEGLLPIVGPPRILALYRPW